MTAMTTQVASARSGTTTEPSPLPRAAIIELVRAGIGDKDVRAVRSGLG